MLSLNRLLFCLILIGNSLGAFSQGKGDGISLHDKNRNTNPHAFYLELGGSSVIYSANYERLLVKSNKTALFARVGLQYIPLKRAQSVIHIPVAANWVLGQKRLKAELGLGALFRIDFNPIAGDGFYLTTPPTRIFLTPVLGIRYFSKRNDYGEYFMMRLSFTPLFGMNVFANPADNSSSLPAILPFAGISFGKTWGGRK
jgi:hypothetical protein